MSEKPQLPETTLATTQPAMDQTTRFPESEQFDAGQVSLLYRKSSIPQQNTQISADIAEFEFGRQETLGPAQAESPTQVLLSKTLKNNLPPATQRENKHAFYRLRAEQLDRQMIDAKQVQTPVGGLRAQRMKLRGMTTDTTPPVGGAGKPKKLPRKRYYNGIGKVNLPLSPKPCPNRTMRELKSSQRSTISKNQSQAEAHSYHKPYPGYSFNFMDTLSSRMQTIQTGWRDSQVLHRPHDQVKQFFDSQQPSRIIDQLGNERQKTMEDQSQAGDGYLQSGQFLTKGSKEEGLVAQSSPFFENLSKEGLISTSQSDMLYFTLDQYKWAQRQGVTSKPNLGQNSLGLKVDNFSRQSVGDDFMLEEAAVSHMLNTKENLPKIQFKLVNELDASSAKASTSFNTLKKSQVSSLAHRHRDQRFPNQESLPFNPISATASEAIEEGVVSEVHSPNHRVETRHIESTILPNEFQPGPRPVKSQQIGRRQIRQRYIEQRRPGQGSKLRISVAQSPSGYRSSVFKGGISSSMPQTPNLVLGKRVQASVLRSSALSPSSQQSHDPSMILPTQTLSQSCISPQEEIRMGSPRRKPSNVRSPLMKKMTYFYDTRPEEIRDDDIQLSPGNLYFEQLNPRVALFMNQVQSNIQNSLEQKQGMRDSADKVFDLMKSSKAGYLQTLLNGEDKGHCKGIKKRMDPTTKYRLQQQMQKYKQIQEDRIEQIKALKKIKDNQKLHAKLERVQERLFEIERQKATSYYSPLDRSMIRKSPDPEGSTAAGLRTARGMQKSFKFIRGAATGSFSMKQIKNNHDLPERLESPIRKEEETASMMIESLSSDEDGSPFQESPQNSSAVEMASRKKNKAMAMFQKRVPTKASLDLRKIPTSKKPAAPSAHHIAHKQMKRLVDLFGLKPITHDSCRLLESALNPDNARAPAHSVLTKIIKIASDDDFSLFKQKVITNNGSMGNQKQAPLFSSYKQLGLSENPEFQQFFITLSEEEASLKYSRLKRQAFKEFLQVRYSKQVGDKVLLFLENQLQTLYRIDFLGFCNVITELINAGPEFYKKILFACLSQANPGRICEHDIFSLVESFKQRDSFFFYKELINQDDVPRDFKEVVDDSDEIFFEAFAADVKAISHAINLRKRLFGIKDMDTNDGMERDVDPKNYTTEEEFEEDMVNQIDYMVGLISRKNPTQYQADVAKLLAGAKSLSTLRNQFVQFIVDKRIIARKEKRQADSQNASFMNDSQITTPQPVNFFKPPQTVTPCLGSGCMGRHANPVSQCSYLTYEDFNKLVVFKKGKVPSFVEDLIDHITNGFLSLHFIETHLQGFREGQQGVQGFPMNLNLQEYIAQKNVEVYGDSQGILPLSITARRYKRGQKTANAAQQAHEITTPYHIQDHYMGEEYGGKLLIRKTGTVKKREDGEEEEQDPLKANMLLINEAKIAELIGYKHELGAANFFRVFRSFYKLAHIPEDAQNNPFALYLDKASILAGFKSVFGIENEEIAVRFASLFIQPEGLPKEYKTDLLRYLYVIQSICEDRERTGSNYLRLGFRFLDYDDNGNIGSVDIFNLKKHLRADKMEKIQNTFYLVSVRKQLHRNMLKMKNKVEHRVITNMTKSHSSVDRIFLSLFNKGGRSTSVQDLESLPEVPEEAMLNTKETGEDKEEREDGGDSNSSVSASKKSDSSNQSKNPEDETVDGEEEDSKTPQPSPFEAINLQEQKIMTPFNKFLMEVHFLREYFVREVVMQKKPDSPKQVLSSNQGFLTLANYDKKFLALFEQKFGVETPTIIHFLRSKLVYQFDLSPKYEEEKGSLMEGFYVEGSQKEETYSVSPEMIAMQEILAAMATPPRPLVK